MSSKSRKQSSPGSQSKGRPGAGEPAAAGGQSAPSHRGGVLDIPDQYLHVPKKVSPLKFALMIGLIIFLLIIFIVPNAIYSWIGRETQEIKPIATWTTPAGEKVEITPMEYENAQRRYASVFKQISRDSISPGQMMALQLGLLDFDDSPSGGVDLTVEDVVRLLVIERLAQDAGIYITKNDLIAHLTPYVWQYGSKEDYQRSLQAYGLGALGFENSLRQALMVQRYLLILAEVAAMPDPTAIEEAWKEEHIETQFDYVEIELTSLAESIRAAVPADEELQAWFDGLEEIETNAFLEPERRRIGFVSYRDPETTPATGLLEKDPEPEEASAEDRASVYYDRVFFDRFLRPEEPEDETTDETGADEEPGAEDAAPAPQELTPYLSREETKDACLQEAPIYFALERWRVDVQKRADEGDTIDLAAEAADLGLAYEAPSEPLSLEEMGAREDLGGFQVAGRAFGTGEGAFGSGLLVRAESIGVLQVTEIVAPAIPPLADIRERVVDKWVEKECEKQALARLNAIRDAFAELVVPEDETAKPKAAKKDEEPRRTSDEAAFRAAAEADGLTVQVRGWLDRRGVPEADPDRDLPAHTFIRNNVEREEPEVDEVVPVSLDLAGERAFLVRKAGSREVPIERMTPGQYESYKSQTENQAVGEFMRSFNLDYLRSQYGLKLHSDEETAPATGAGDAAAIGEGDAKTGEGDAKAGDEE